MTEREKIKCSHCGHTQSTNLYERGALSVGVWVKCKNCGREFELKIFQGKQFE